MIKKLILAALVGLGAVFAASAQKAELAVSYGAYTQMDATDMHDGWHHVNNAWGALNVGLNFRVLPKIWIGPSYTFSSTTTKGGPEHSNIAYHAIMLNGRYHYYKNSIVTMYAKLGIGVEFSYMQPRGGDNYTKSYCAFQIVPIGAQVDLNRNWAMFGELGFGAQGLLQVGAKLRF
ncbi:MAG: outer membrane beta-barrel protein [Muribaculaceae bacterium]|nr:outer membrane beta-barrel protein [Muribaculaceae bacterium]